MKSFVNFPDPNYIVIYTPKVIVSDCDVPPAPVETLNFFYRRQNISQTRFLEKVQAPGELMINSSAWESQIISAAASHSHVLPAGSRSRGFITQSTSQVIQLEIFRSRSHKLRFVTDQCGQSGKPGTRKHIPPEVITVARGKKFSFSYFRMCCLPSLKSIVSFVGI